MMIVSAQSRLLEYFNRFASQSGIAYYHTEGNLSFRSLYASACTLAHQLAATGSDRLHPVIIYGHKDRRFLVAYWACILAGRPLVPVDINVEPLEVQRIRTCCGPNALIAASSRVRGPEFDGLDVINVRIHKDISLPMLRTEAADRDTMYILFSSGTTGPPKGIKISYANVAYFVKWLDSFVILDDAVAVSGNVRYCFDVSMFELWLSWSRYISISALDHTDLMNTRKYIARYHIHRVGVWVSTPSLARAYLADPYFVQAALPSLSTFIFCGEVLTKELTIAIWRKFPRARIYNTYGPTECTVAVTGVQILPAHIESKHELPIGFVRPGTNISVTFSSVGESRWGEFVISGIAVGLGYIGCSEQSAVRFPSPDSYRTGDLGYCEGELWYFRGRADREIKVQGRRIDLNEIEAMIRTLSGVSDVVVDAPIFRGICRGTVAFVVGPQSIEQLSALANKLAEYCPSFMIPRMWYGLPDTALNANGKLATRGASGGNTIAYRFSRSHH